MPENMKRKITVEAPISKSNDTHRRPSVFERLGTKAPAPLSASPVIITSETISTCRHWAQGGTCPYGKNCKYSNTHTLISPSKQRAAKKENEANPKSSGSLLPPGLKSTGNLKEDLKRLHSAVIKKSHTGTSPDLNWENWDQQDLEYEDEKVLEKRRQLLQRELELQMSKEKDEKKKKVKKVKKGVSSSSSTSASSSSSTDSSSSSDDSSSTSSSTSVDSRRKKVKTKTGKRDSSSSTSGDRAKKKAATKSATSNNQPSVVKKPVVPRKDESRSTSTKRRESPAKRTAPATSQSQAPAKKRDNSPPRTRHRSLTPPSHSHNDNKDAKKPAGRNSSPVSKRSLSNDRKDKRSVSPRSSARNREREREREKEKAKEREKEKERDRDKQREKPRGQDRSRSPPKGKGKDRLPSPKRNSRPRDPRKKDSPDAAKDKGGRNSPSKSRRSSSRGRNTSLDNKYPASNRDNDRRDTSRNDSRDVRDKVGGAKKSERDNRKPESSDKGGKSKDSNLNKSSSNRSRDDNSRREDASTNRDRKPPATSSSKSNHDRDAKDDKDRNKDNRDNRDNRDNADPRLRSTLRLREMRDSEREKEREEALERCKERQRERERKAREEKAREHERELPSLLMIATHNPIKNTRNSTGTEGSKGLDKGSERGSERSHDKERERDFDKDRERDRNLSRPSDRDRDRDRDRVSDRSYDRGPDHDRDRDRDRGIPDRSFDRERPPVKGPHDRGLNRAPRDHSFERTADRSFDREPERGVFEPRHLERDNHSERDYGRDRPPLDDKGAQSYDSPYDSRRGRDDRGRYSDQMERSRYDEVMPPKGDQRRPGSDSRIFPDDRRVGGRREGRNSLEPPWDGRPRNDRVEADSRRRPGYERDEPRSPLPPIKGRDWEGRDYPESRREWEGRGGRRGAPQDWDNQRRGEWSDKEGTRDDWDLYPGAQSDWPPEERWPDDWERERPSRQSGSLSSRPGPPPSRGTGHRDSEPLDYNQRDVKQEEPIPLDEVKIKEPPAEPVPVIVAKEEDKPAEPTEPPVFLKRLLDVTDGEADKPEAKKICLEEQVPLEEDLSDISDDDADEILNREDIELATNLAIQEQNVVQPSTEDSLDVTKTEAEHSRDAITAPDLSRDSNDQQSMLPQDEETIDAMNFEDISDEELEEEAKAGLGDALGVDWASLVAESRPRPSSEVLPGSGKRRWDGYRMLSRLGVSYEYAGQDFIDKLVSGFEEINREDKEQDLSFLHPVALIHVALREKRERRKTLFETAGPYKRALSARRDLLVRRQLCNLPVNETTVEAQGVNTEDIYRLAVQLFERERGV